MIPYTVTLMTGINARLMEKAKDEKTVSDSETRELLRKWKALNWGRAVIVGIGAVVAMVGTVVR